jgi:cell cycle sensor histidine kinase DivJ
LALVGHELRAPLNAIVGSSENLMGAGGAGLAGRQERYGEIIHHSARRMQETVNAALDLSSIESGRYDLSFETIDMADLVRECCRAMAAAAQRSGIALIESIAPGLPPVTADRRACRQILLNLLLTAMKSTPPDGYVAVDIGHDGADVILNVNATGMADRPRFEAPFRRKTMRCAAKDEDGLLLSVARGLVGLHGGRLRMAKAPGGRSSVRISLPVDRRAASVVAPETARLNHDVLALKTG